MTEFAILQFAGDAGDTSMLKIFDEVVGPAAERFKPDIILVIHPLSSSSDRSRAPAASLPLVISAAARARKSVSLSEQIRAASHSF